MDNRDIKYLIDRTLAYSEIVSEYARLVSNQAISLEESEKLDDILYQAELDEILQSLIFEVDQKSFQSLEISNNIESSYLNIDSENLSIENVINYYYYLASRESLSDSEQEQFEIILKIAEENKVVGLLINEIDELTFHKLGFLEDKNNLESENQKNIAKNILGLHDNFEESRFNTEIVQVCHQSRIQDLEEYILSERIKNQRVEHDLELEKEKVKNLEKQLELERKKVKKIQFQLQLRKEKNQDFEQFLNLSNFNISSDYLNNELENDGGIATIGEPICIEKEIKKYQNEFLTEVSKLISVNSDNKINELLSRNQCLLTQFNIRNVDSEDVLASSILLSLEYIEKNQYRIDNPLRLLYEIGARIIREESGCSREKHFLVSVYSSEILDLIKSQKKNADLYDDIERMGQYRHRLAKSLRLIP